jgi:hypothetical protein
MSARWLPKGFHTITPNIIVDDAEQAAAFFKKAFGASESYRLTMSNGKIAHCEISWGTRSSISAHQWTVLRLPSLQSQQLQVRLLMHQSLRVQQL